jgi:hypothetical protein
MEAPIARYQELRGIICPELEVEHGNDHVKAG